MKRSWCVQEQAKSVNDTCHLLLLRLAVARHQKARLRGFVTPMQLPAHKATATSKWACLGWEAGFPRLAPGSGAAGPRGRGRESGLAASLSSPSKQPASAARKQAALPRRTRLSLPLRSLSNKIKQQKEVMSLVRFISPFAQKMTISKIWRRLQPKLKTICVAFQAFILPPLFLVLDCT